MQTTIRINPSDRGNPFAALMRIATSGPDSLDSPPPLVDLCM